MQPVRWSFRPEGKTVRPPVTHWKLAANCAQILTLRCSCIAKCRTLHIINPNGSGKNSICACRVRATCCSTSCANHHQFIFKLSSGGSHMLQFLNIPLMFTIQTDVLFLFCLSCVWICTCLPNNLLPSERKLKKAEDPKKDTRTSIYTLKPTAWKSFLPQLTYQWNRVFAVWLLF